MNEIAPPRAELTREPIAAEAFGVVEKPLSLWERMTGQGWLRKLVLLIVLALIWEIYARWLDNPLLFPTFSATLEAFLDTTRRAAARTGSISPE